MRINSETHCVLTQFCEFVVKNSNEFNNQPLRGMVFDDPTQFFKFGVKAIINLGINVKPYMEFDETHYI